MSSASTTSFVHQALRTRVIAKPGAVAELGRELARLGCQRPLLLSGQRTAAGPVWADVRHALGERPFMAVQDIEPHSSLTTVERVAQLAREQGADALVAVGGGSVSDTAKAVALVLAEGAPLAQHASRFVPPTTVLTPDLVKPKLPILSIAMTASGAEATPSLGIRTPEGIKLLFWDAQLASRVIFLDPVANLATPASVMLSTGMNGLAHCIEGLYSKAGSPITAILALDGIVKFDQALRQVAAMPQDVSARANLLLAAHISGMVLASARSCLHHALCHVMGATFGVAHGDVNSVVLPHALRFNAAAAVRELAPAAARLSLPGQAAEAGEQLVNWLHELQQAIGVPSRLRELGVAREQLAGVAEKTLHERGLAYNPRSVHNAGELEAILLAAW
ncbi:MAG: alcohol dehydrogenase class IV [Polaromonas sp.]|jgi:alcohol dehydrogenase class IV